MKHVLVGLVLSLTGGVWQLAQAELADDVIQHTFYPYAIEKPALSGLAPGTTISQDSWEAAQNYVPAEILAKIKAGGMATLYLGRRLGVALATAE